MEMSTIVKESPMAADTSIEVFIWYSRRGAECRALALEDLGSMKLKEL